MFIIKTKKQVMGIALSAFFGISIGVILTISPILKTFSIEGGKKTILIDAGHGMPDGGTVGYNGTIEEKINLEIAKKIEEVLKGKGFLTAMTRENNDGLAVDENSSIREMKINDMKIRKKLMKDSNADIFISIHMNSFPDESVSGLRVFYSEQHPEIKTLTETIQGKIGDITGAKTYAIKTADKDLFLMKNPPIPSILIECGFLSNAEEEKNLSDEEYQAKIAWALADAIEKYYKN